jgi:molecular chaperone GrpE
MAGFYDPFSRATTSVPMAEYRRLAQAYKAAMAESKQLQEALKRQEGALDQQAQLISQLKRRVEESEAKLSAVEAELAQRHSQARAAKPEPETRSQVQASGAEPAPPRSQATQEPKSGDEVDWRSQYLRLQADLDNIKKRQERRYAQLANEDRQRILRDMLSLADNLELGLQHLGRDHQAGDNPWMDSYLQNLESTYRAFLETLKRHGVERISPEGESFDPQVHEAMGQMPSDAVPEGDIAHVIQSGYLDNGQLLRPARVLLSAGSAAPEAP